MRIIFMGTPEFALPALEALIGSAHEVIAVYSQPPRPKNRGHKMTPSPTHQLAEKHGIPVFTPTSLKSEEAQAEFAALKADIAVVAAYGLILPQAILDAPTHSCINIHPSALPRWRGAAPIQRPIMAGDTTTEICMMKMDAGLDTGDVYLRSGPITIPDDMNAGALHDLLAEQSTPLLLEALEQIANGTATATPQAKDDITYANKITKEEARIDWSKSAIEIYDHIRGLAPHPGAFFEFQNERFKILEAEINQTDMSKYGFNAAPGTVIDKHMVVACGSGLLHPYIIQRSGSKPMNVQDFLNGYKIPEGSLLT